MIETYSVEASEDLEVLEEQLHVRQSFDGGLDSVQSSVGLEPSEKSGSVPCGRSSRRKD